MVLYTNVYSFVYEILSNFGFNANGVQLRSPLITPRSRVVIHLLEGTVTSSIAATLRHAYNGPALLKAIRLKNDWSRATVESINWNAHGSAIRKQISCRIHYVKYVHDILPTHSQLNRIDKGRRTCPCCQSPNEDRDHILRCPSPEREKWRQEFIGKLAAACTKHHVVRKWLYPGSDSHDEPQQAHYTEEIHHLTRTQTSIGWRQLFYGRFCQAWSDVQQQHMYNIRHHLPKHNTVFWEQWYDL